MPSFPLFLCRVAWGFGLGPGLHIAHASVYAIGSRDRDKRQGGERPKQFFLLLASFSCLLLAHLLIGRKGSLLRFSGVGLKMEKLHLVSWQLQRLSGGTVLELRQRLTFRQERENKRERINRPETMLLWISYVSNQDLGPCS